MPIPTPEDMKLKLTEVPEIDALLRKIVDIATQQKVMTFVYRNLTAHPKVKGNVQRAVYTVPNVGKKLEYVFNDEDINWLARSLNGEGGGAGRVEASTITWTMFNRWLLNPNGPARFPKFWQFIQHFSQPVNPRWLRNGAYCRVGGSKYGDEGCLPAKLARRDQIFYGPVPKVCTNYANEMALGTLEQPPVLYVNFASTPATISFSEKVSKLYHIPSKGKGRGNYFFTFAQEAMWTQRGKNPYKVAYYSGVSRIGSKGVPTFDVAAPLTKNQLINYVASYVASTQRSQQNQVITKSSANMIASENAQQEVVQKRQQMANLAQSAIALKDVKISTFSKPAIGPDGFQTGADDTWNKVG